jgi:hypothetical protein
VSRTDDDVRWLAEKTGLDRAQVERGLDEGEARRRSVVAELVAADLGGAELLAMVTRLTGLPAAEARELIAATVEDGAGHEPD